MIDRFSHRHGACKARVEPQLENSQYMDSTKLTMSKLIFLVLILILSPSVLAQDLGPVGPQKAPVLDVPEPDSGQKKEVPLPYKPKPKETPPSQTNSPEIEQIPVPKKERIIPIIPSKYPEILGAPDPEGES